MKYSPAPVPQQDEEIKRYLYGEVRKLREVLDLVDSSASFVRTESVGSSFAMSEGSSVVLADTTDGDVTLTLPQPSQGRRVTVKKVDAANTLTISPYGTETIDAATSHVITALNVSVTLVADEDTNWFIV